MKKTVDTAIQICKQNIPVKIVSKDNVKSINIRVKDNFFYVTKPKRVAIFKVMQVLHDKKEKLKEIYEKSCANKLSLDKDNYIMLFKEKYLLKIIEERDNDKVVLVINRSAKTIFIYVKEKMQESEKLKRIKEELAKMYLENTKNVVRTRLDYWLIQTNAKINGYTFREKKTNLGTYNIKTKTICFNSRLSVLSVDLIDCIIVHELMHQFEHNHSNAFYAKVERYIPEYKRKKKLIDELSKEMKIL